MVWAPFYIGLDNAGSPFGTIPYVGCPVCIKFWFVADHQNTSLIIAQGML